MRISESTTSLAWFSFVWVDCQPFSNVGDYLYYLSVAVEIGRDNNFPLGIWGRTPPIHLCSKIWTNFWDANNKS